MSSSKDVHIPFMLIEASKLKKLKRLKRLGLFVSNIFGKDMDSLLKRSGLSMSKDEYMTGALLSALIYSFLFGGMLFALANMFRDDIRQAIVLGIGCGFGIGFMFFTLISGFPRTLVKKKADLIDRHLIYALKDFLMQISAGNSAYNAAVELAHSGYGQVSIEFENAAKQIQTGMPIEDAFEELASTNDSKHFKKVIWQMVNTLRAGASLKDALKSIIKDLNDDQKSKIVNFANELNLWSLIYMLFAVAIPSIGTTMMVILSAFGGADLTPSSFIFFVTICSIIQFAIVGFIKARRPVVE